MFNYIQELSMFVLQAVLFGVIPAFILVLTMATFMAIIDWLVTP